ncbi:hypothetical protein T459_19578 [Capsicum annuum]|uniref:Uncharacterized protein n=1 Tax=Capsicum annuum TaxID=4072 RepID=A0A2G2Z236_CAPAN|nr:hypothetical protein T459_19578 [Capsicum annuum]
MFHSMLQIDENITRFICSPILPNSIFEIIDLRPEFEEPKKPSNLGCLTSIRLHGSIPSIICQLQFLQILDLSANGLSGKIPHCFNNFTLLYLDNSSGDPMEFIVQGFYGKYPRSYSYIGDLLVQWKNQESENRNPLLYLKTIDLSSNELVGGIPEEIAEMRGLKSLNLSRNDLNGTLIVGIGQMKMVVS